MNKNRLIWGIVCLVIAAFLAALNVALPAEKIMFNIGDRNMPWVPVIVLGVVGIILLVSAVSASQVVTTTETPAQPEAIKDPQKAALNKRLESVAWGCFLILLGGFMFVPDKFSTRGWWSIGVGLIFLGLNAARYFNQIKMSGFTTFLGIFSLLGGVVQIFSAQNFEGALLLIILGLYLIFKQWFDKNKLFGKAEEA